MALGSEYLSIVSGHFELEKPLDVRKFFFLLLPFFFSNKIHCIPICTEIQISFILGVGILESCRGCIFILSLSLFFKILLNRTNLPYFYFCFSKAITSLPFLDIRAEETVLITHPSASLPLSSPPASALPGKDSIK